ncbi:DJ-1/PfpI family protein [Streptomyces sp. NPDC057199]|uniref:DJ-1/PfpI family protein n=1 Tax=Streptomyces sp. NPDC057199 TaxID=3346047 RepID=UPI0036327463
MSEEPLAVFDFGSSDQKPLQIGILIGPQFAPMDMIGVHSTLGMVPGTVVHLLWKNTDDLLDGTPSFPMYATTSFEDCPKELDLLFAPAMAPEVLEDEEVLTFLADRGARSRWIGATCAGSLLMGAAGLLRGYRATTNFQVHHLLSRFGAVPEHGNIVEDGNRITAGPASGSFEIGLRLVQNFYGDEVAREMELTIEYAPTPLFGVGTPNLAGSELTKRTLDRSAPLTAIVDTVTERAARRLEARPSDTSPASGSASGRK